MTDNRSGSNPKSVIVSMMIGTIIGILLIPVFFFLMIFLTDFLVTTFSISTDGFTLGMMLVMMVVIVVIVSLFFFLVSIIVPPDAIIFTCDRCGKERQIKNKKNSHTFHYWNWKKIIGKYGWKKTFRKEYCPTCIKILSIGGVK